MNSEDPELAVDLRALGKGRQEKFGVFWNAPGTYFDEFITAQEKRNGNVGYMPVAIRVIDAADTSHTPMFTIAQLWLNNGKSQKVVTFDH